MAFDSDRAPAADLSPQLPTGTGLGTRGSSARLLTHPEVCDIRYQHDIDQTSGDDRKIVSCTFCLGILNPSHLPHRSAVSRGEVYHPALEPTDEDECPSFCAHVAFLSTSTKDWVSEESLASRWSRTKTIKESLSSPWRLS